VRWAVATLILAAFAFPASAGADVPAAWQHKALETAQRVWQPACGTLTVRFADPATVGGDASWGGWAYLGQCAIYEPAGHDWLGYPEFCSNVLHEAGHAAGREHSDRGIMQPHATISRFVSTVRIDGRVRRMVVWTGADQRCVRPQDLRARDN
jgi:hypothetical protein